MKYIVKQSQPHELIAWARMRESDEQGQKTNWGYDDMPAQVREAVKRSLIQEQGGLCCYTGRRIAIKTSHIEHLKPQSLCTDHQDTDYGNLLAAYPSSDSGTPYCPYGAHVKADWYDQHLFVHPLRRDCETRFLYRSTGKVISKDLNDKGALETIKRLCLDNPKLVQLRKAVIEGLALERLTRSQIQRLIIELDRRDGEGNYKEFCFVLKQACEKFLKRFD